jgi:hypothetical protein
MEKDPRDRVRKTTVELKCKNCGGKLSAKDDDVFGGDGMAIVRRDSTLRCDHCGAEYLPGDELSLPTSVNIQVNQQIETVESGSTVIGAQIDLGKSTW